MTDMLMEYCKTIEEADTLFCNFSNKHLLFPHPDNVMSIYSIISWSIWNTDFSKTTSNLR